MYHPRNIIQFSRCILLKVSVTTFWFDLDIESNNNSFDDSALTIDDDEMPTIVHTDLYNNFNMNNNNKSHGFIQQAVFV